jgi:hypothetical protein
MDVDLEVGNWLSENGVLDILENVPRSDSLNGKPEDEIERVGELPVRYSIVILKGQQGDGNVGRERGRKLDMKQARTA